ncbi:MAG: alpha/beta fold hydrolase [Phycisphaerales bacterium]
MTVAPPTAPKDGWTGLWMGRTTGPRTLDVMVDVLATEPTPSGRISLPTAGILDQELAAMKVADGTLRGAWNPGIGRVELEVKVTPDADALEGSVTMVVPGVKDAQVLPVRLFHTVRAEKAPGAVDWVGTLTLPELSLEMGLTLATLPDGKALGAFDVPAQGVSKLPVLATIKDGTWVIVVPLQVPAHLVLAPKGEELVGQFSQGTVVKDMTFKRGQAKAGLAAGGAAAGDAAASARPQTPKPPFPYTEQEVKIPHRTGHVLAGTFTLPEGASPEARVPAVVLATGSGPQDRNETLLGHQPFRVLADALARAGIAVLRCDDRGTGQSTGAFSTATSLDFANDVATQFWWLTQNPNVDPRRIGLLGHSEGGLLVAMVAADAVVGKEAVQPAFLALLAGPGVPGHAVLRVQNEALLKASGVTGQELEDLVQAHSAVMDAAMANAQGAALTARVANLVHLQLQLASKQGQTVTPEEEKAMVDQAVASLQHPWMRVFLRMDPAASLRVVKCPCLVLNGSLDTQVVPSQNLPPIKAALEASGARFTIHEYPGLNHLFQPCKTGSPSEYAQIDITMDPLVLHDVAEWIRTTTGVTTPWKKAP